MRKFEKKELERARLDDCNKTISMLCSYNHQLYGKESFTSIPSYLLLALNDSKMSSFPSPVVTLLIDRVRIPPKTTPSNFETATHFKIMSKMIIILISIIIINNNNNNNFHNKVLYKRCYYERYTSVCTERYRTMKPVSRILRL